MNNSGPLCFCREREAEVPPPWFFFFAHEMKNSGPWVVEKETQKPPPLQKGVFDHKMNNSGLLCFYREREAEATVGRR